MGSLSFIMSQHNTHFTYRSLSHIVLNESNYDKHPDIFSTFVNVFSGVSDGIQECATYNPPGPTKPGGYTPVCIFVVHILINYLSF